MAIERTSAARDAAATTAEQSPSDRAEVLHETGPRCHTLVQVTAIQAFHGGLLHRCVWRDRSSPAREEDLGARGVAATGPQKL